MVARLRVSREARERSRQEKLTEARAERQQKAERERQEVAEAEQAGVQLIRGGGVTGFMKVYRRSRWGGWLPTRAAQHGRRLAALCGDVARERAHAAVGGRIRHS